ncbi:hypothetical protein [Sphingobacterium mizutaii]|uniref:hypothetical protein n=1 Tax=Sphingobacterium mizutaii TaxID=1010 RepID=UPI00289EE1F2|nr:hypothetical protein [Sphingobacterium mizutaii]
MARAGERLKIEVQGIDYITPPVPPLRSIRNYKTAKADQVWVRDETYLQWSWNTKRFDEEKNRLKLWWEDPEPGQMEWYEAELHRIHNGDWIMINGEPVWFNKYCYFFHQWFMLLEQIYPIFKDTSLEYFRFVELCENDPGALGDCGIKGRRVGLTSMASSIDVLVAITESNTLQGMVSKTGTDAYEMYLMCKNGIENLPQFFMPEINKVTESEIHIAKQQKKISANNKTVTADKGLNNRINWLDTAENAYDGRRLRRVKVDEAAKFEKVNVQVLINKISDTLVVGSSIGGYMSVFSTVNKGDKGGDNFRKIWDGSDHVNGKKDMFGRTQTKLKRFFIAGFRGLYGYIDKYGNSVIDTPTPEQSKYLASVIDPSTGRPACLNPNIGARQFLEESRKMLAHDPELYAEQVRKYPFTWEEVFKGANNMCHFDLDELNKQIELIEDELREKQISENGRRVTWKESPNGDAYFVDDPKGISFLLEILPPEQANLRQMVGSTLVPMHTAYGAAGLDPYANSQKTAELGSDACLMIHSRYNPLFPDTTGMPVAMILGRLPTKDDFYNQCKLMLRYYGIAMLAERAPTDWEDYFIRHHLADPLEVKEDRMGYLHTTLRTGKTEVYGVAPQDANLREAHLTYMKEYARNNMHKIKFLRLLNDMLAFNLKDRLLYDACLAWGYALIALSVTVDEPKDPEREEPMIQTFDLSAA